MGVGVGGWVALVYGQIVAYQWRAHEVDAIMEGDFSIRHAGTATGQIRPISRCTSCHTSSAEDTLWNKSTTIDTNISEFGEYHVRKILARSFEED